MYTASLVLYTVGLVSTGRFMGFVPGKNLTCEVGENIELVNNHSVESQERLKKKEKEFCCVFNGKKSQKYFVPAIR